MCMSRCSALAAVLAKLSTFLEASQILSTVSWYDREKGFATADNACLTLPCLYHPTARCVS